MIGESMTHIMGIQELQDIFRKAECVGLIGCGKFGHRLRNIADACNVRVMLCDPPLSRLNADEQFDAICEQWGNGMGGCNPDIPDNETFLPKETLARRCDVIAIQVPPIESGPDATVAMIDHAFLALCRPGVRILCFSDRSIFVENLSYAIEMCDLTD